MGVDVAAAMGAAVVGVATATGSVGVGAGVGAGVRAGAGAGAGVGATATGMTVDGVSVAYGLRGVTCEVPMDAFSALLNAATLPNGFIIIRSH